VRNHSGANRLKYQGRVLGSEGRGGAEGSQVPGCAHDSEDQGVVAEKDTMIVPVKRGDWGGLAEQEDEEEAGYLAEPGNQTEPMKEVELGGARKQDGKSGSGRPSGGHWHWVRVHDGPFCRLGVCSRREEGGGWIREEFWNGCAGYVLSQGTCGFSRWHQYKQGIIQPSPKNRH